MEQRPLPNAVLAAAEPLEEPRLELVPALDDPEALEADLEEAPEDEADEAVAEASPETEELEALESAVAAHDPLKVYVRSVGAARRLPRLEERDLARRKDAGDEA